MSTKFREIVSIFGECLLPILCTVSQFCCELYLQVVVRRKESVVRKVSVMSEWNQRNIASQQQQQQSDDDDTAEGDSENRDNKERERKVSSLSWLEGPRLSPLLERIRIQRKMSFYLDIDPTTTPPPSPVQQRAGQQ